MRASLLAIAAIASFGCSSTINPDVDRLGRGSDAGPPPVEMDAGGADAGPPACVAGQTLCAGVCVDPRSDPTHCGGCGNACPAGDTCVDGTCSCPAGDPRCGVVGDPDRCGATEARCRDEQWCLAGACACRPGFTAVGEQCVDLGSDPENCGEPGRVCADGVCGGGECRARCPAGTLQCGDACVFRADPRHCGECDRACQADEVCIRGDCRDYAATACRMCPCDTCGERQCCSVLDLGAICVEGEDCPGG